MQDAGGNTYCLSATQTSGSVAVLATCNASDVKQIWGYDGNKEFEAAAAVTGNLNGYCF